MKALHITSHIGTTKNIKNVFDYLNIGDRLVTESLIYSNYYIDKESANNIWYYYKDKLSDYKIIIFTDTSMVARPFLQNIEDHNLILIIYITNRFDWGMWNVIDNDYYDLYAKLSTNKRVFFCSDNGYDQYYAKTNNIYFTFETPIKLTPFLNNRIIQNSTNKFFIYNRGTKIENYQHFLLERNVEFDIFGEGYDRFKDHEHICEYKGFIHLPYQTNIQSLWENLGYYIIYFIPSKKFITELIINTSWYYWEEKYRHYDLLMKSIELSEWHCDENEMLFEFFDSWDHLQYKINSITDDYLINKKQIIKDFIKKSNEINLEKWVKILNIL
jgi:hypothetical protein